MFAERNIKRDQKIGGGAAFSKNQLFNNCVLSKRIISLVGYSLIFILCNNTLRLFSLNSRKMFYIFLYPRG